MKVAGNASFTEFLARHPGAYTPTAHDAKAKYQSRAAGLYRDELSRRVKEDEVRFGPGKVVLDGVPSEAAAQPAINTADADFFDSWDKPASKPKTTSSQPTSPPLLTLSPSGSAAVSRSTSPAPSPSPTISSPVVAAAVSPPLPTEAASSQSRTVTSASLRATQSSSANPSAATRTRLGAQRVGKAKLGAKKGAAINFEEAERKAREEEERIKQLGYNSKREEEEAVAAAAAAASAASAASSAPAASSARSKAAPNAKDARAAHAKKESVDLDRLGMGVRRLGFGQVSGIGGDESAKAAEKERKAGQRRANGFDDDQSRFITTDRHLFPYFFFDAFFSFFLATDSTTYARDNFSAHKGISSDMYFQRNAYDTQSHAEAQSRLQGFQGATAISSNQYFGIEEEEADQIEDSLMSGDGFASLQKGAREVVNRIVQEAGFEDVQGLQDTLRQGALRVSFVVLTMYVFFLRSDLLPFFQQLSDYLARLQ
jgi:ADP-ribosylation factor GTPase-activating protein 2/3